MSDPENAQEPRGKDEHFGREHHHEEMTGEDRAWLESDLSRISGYEPHEWAEGELEAGEPVRYVPGVGAVAGGPYVAGPLRERGEHREDAGPG